MAAVISRVSISRTPNSKVYKQNTAGSGLPKNLFNPDSELEQNRRSTRAPSSPPLDRLHNKSPQKCGGHENQSVEKLGYYALYEAEETTQKIHGCLKVAEGIREDASKTLVNLNHQGEQITQTHLTAASIDLDLSRGEKLLGSLGGLFSKTWKPKKSREIKGPVLTRGESFIRRANHLEQKQKLGLNPRRSQSNPRRFPSQPSSSLERFELEKEKQNAAVSDLSNLLVDLKAMAVDMGSQIDRQNKALDHMQNDVDELNIRIKVANLRARHLLRS